MKKHLLTTLTLLIVFLAALLTATPFIPGKKGYVLTILTYLIKLFTVLLSFVIVVALAKSTACFLKSLFDLDKNDKKVCKIILLSVFLAFTIALMVIVFLIITRLFKIKEIGLCI